MSYGSVRGEMKVGEGTRFVTEVPVQGVLPMFPAEGITDQERMLGYLKEEADKDACRFRGHLLGGQATSAGSPRSAASPKWLARRSCRKVFIDEIKRRLEELVHRLARARLLRCSITTPPGAR